MIFLAYSQHISIVSEASVNHQPVMYWRRNEFSGADEELAALQAIVERPERQARRGRDAEEVPMCSKGRVTLWYPLVI